MRTGAVNQYESYKSKHVNDTQIKELDQRVDKLSQKIQREKSRWCGRNRDLIKSLEEKLLLVTYERDGLRVINKDLLQAGKEAKTFIKDLKESYATAEYSMGAGFGAGAIAAVALGLNAALTSICVVASAYIGSYVGVSLTKKAQKEN